MSLFLVLILFIILAADFLIAMFGGMRNEGKEKLLRLLQRYALIFAGYAVVGLIAFFGGRMYPNLEYISGLLLDPIFRYAVSLLDKLKSLMVRPKKEDKADKTEKADKPEKAEESKPVTVVAADVKKDSVMIEIEPEAKPKAKSRVKKVVK